ncbi:hypothetical protein BV20DRAFT_971065 [Pilatotrama ljubarskyi]|nr:hypothetical protein BV20DRAFT_971065 [Pilatotrama ljubarskyi]
MPTAPHSPLAAGGHPFTYPSADIVFVSSDNVHFKLHKVVLSLASEFFEDMFRLPQPTHFTRLPPGCQLSGPASPEVIDDLPAVHVTETGLVLENLFRLCYPVDDPTLEDIRDVHLTLEAALKYEMREAIKITKRRLTGFACNAPLRVYCIACRLSLEDIAAIAAAETRSQKTQETYVAELEEIPVGAYHRLLHYCGHNANVPVGFTFHRAALGLPDLSSDSLSLQPQTAQMSLANCDAPAPFDNEAAEVAITGSDGLRLRVFKYVIQLSSPVLTSRLSTLPASTPIALSLPESSRVLSALFKICYPVENPRLSTDLNDIFSLFVAAEKYGVAKAVAFARKALDEWVTDQLSDALLLYLVACRVGSKDLAIKAARQVSRKDISAELNPQLDAFGVVAGTLWRLISWQRKCEAAVRTIITTRDWLTPDWQTTLKSRCRRNSSQIYPCWFDGYFSRLAKTNWPDRGCATEDALLRSTAFRTASFGSVESICNYCADAQGVLLLVRFSKYVADAIDRRETEVTLDWKYPCMIK